MSSKRGWKFPIYIFLLICLNTLIAACDSKHTSDAGTPESNNPEPKDGTVWKGEDYGYLSKTADEISRNIEEAGRAIEESSRTIEEKRQ